MFLLCCRKCWICWEEERVLGGLAIAVDKVGESGSGARLALLQLAQLLQFCEIVTARGQFGYGLPELLLADFQCLLVGSVDQLPEFAAA